MCVAAIMFRVRRVGPYRLVQEIGSGAYGHVYKCVDTRNQEIRAIKKVELPRIRGNAQVEAALDSMRREVEILKKFDSDYIIKCYGDMETEHNYYIVLEYCDGGSLKSKIGVGEEEAMRYVRQIVAAMKAMYGLKVRHRDLKPDNILLSNGVAKVGDFGTAKAYAVSMEDLVGTYPYMAPEVRFPGPESHHDVKADIWSLGVLTYELITGQLPYEHDHLQDEIFQYGILGTIGKLQASESVKNLLMNIFQKQPEKRITFENLCDHEAITGPIACRQFPLVPLAADDGEANVDRALKLMRLAKKEKVKHPFLLYLKVCQLQAHKRDTIFLEAMKEAEHWVYRSDWESYTTDRLFIELAVSLCQNACRGLHADMIENYEQALALLTLVKDYPFLQSFKNTIVDCRASFNR